MGQIIEVPGHGPVEFPDGMSDDDIVAAIKRNMPGQNHPEGLAGTASGYVQGANRGISDILGGPVDLVSSGLRAIGVPVGDEPIGGSKSFRRLQNAVTGLAHKVTGLGNEGVTATYENINNLPPAQRLAARAGEVTGQTLGALVPVLGAAKGMSAAQIAASQAPSRVANGSVLGNLGRSMVAEAAINPSAFVASQIPATVGQAAGAVGAELAMPGSDTAQFVGQLGGGLLGAGVGAGAKAASGPIDNLWAKIKEPFTTVGPEGAKTAAARALTPHLATNGEDAGGIINRLQQPQVVAGQTAGEIAQSPVLTGVQEMLAKNNTDLANAVKGGRTQYAENLKAGTSAAFDPGNPADLTTAATQKQNAFVKAMDELVSDAERRAMESTKPVLPNDAGTRAALSEDARDILDKALKTARGQESALWGKIPMDTPVDPKNVLSEFAQVKAGMLPEEKLNPLLESVMRRFSGEAAAGTGPTRAPVTDPKTGKLLYYREVPGKAAVEAAPITFQDVQLTRSHLLDEAKRLASQGEMRDARRLRQIASGADPTKEGGLLADMASINHPAVDEARSFSKALNDRFTRSYAGDILGTKPTGAPAVPPELTLQTTMGTTPDRAAMRMRQLRDAAPDMTPQQEQFLRSVSAEVVDSSGKVIPGKIDAFVQKHEALLNDFPQYRQSLLQAKERQLALDSVLERTGDAAKTADKTAAFARVLKAGENPATAVGQALSGNTPVRDMRKLAGLATGSGPEAVGGLRASILEHVMTEASTKNGLSYGKVDSILNAPMSPNGPSLLKSMRDNGVINATQQYEIAKHIEAGKLAEAAKVAGVEIKEFGSGPGMWGRALSRVVGAKVGSQVSAAMGGGGSVQVPGIFAGIGEKLSSRLPADRAQAMMAEALAADNPATLIDILERVGASAYGSRKFDGPNGEFTKMLVLLRNSVPHDHTEVGNREQMLYDIGHRPQGGIPIPGQTLGITIRKKPGE